MNWGSLIKVATNYNILTGYCLADQLSRTRINQDFIVCRECLAEGAVAGEQISPFWKGSIAVRGKTVSTDDHTVPIKNHHADAIAGIRSRHLDHQRVRLGGLVLMLGWFVWLFFIFQMKIWQIP